MSGSLHVYYYFGHLISVGLHGCPIGIQLERFVIKYL